MTLTFAIEGNDTEIQLGKSLFSGISVGNTPLADVMDKLPEPLLMGSLNMVFERTFGDLRALLQKDIQLKGVKFNTEPFAAAWAVSIAMSGEAHSGLVGVNAQNKTWLEALPRQSASGR